MNANEPQYTIRNMPKPVGLYLRKLAKHNGQSLNQTIIEELSERAGIRKDGKQQSLLESLSWFIGSGSDKETERILSEDDLQQKAIASSELAKLDDIVKL